MLIDAAEFADKITAPTDDDLKVQFDGYAKSVPGRIDPGNNPFGFGYLNSRSDQAPVHHDPGFRSHQSGHCTA